PNAAETYEHLGFRRIGPVQVRQRLTTSGCSWLARRCMPAEPPARRARHAPGRGQPCEAGLADWSAPCQAEPTTCTIGGINFEGHETGQAIGVVVAADQPLVIGIRELQMT